MAISAFPYTAVLDVSASSLLGNNTGSPAAAIALTATQVRTLLSVYTSAQVDALLANYQPLDADLTAIAALTTTSFGRSLLTQADAAATRTTIGAGTSSFSGAYGDLTGIPATFAPASHTHAAADITSGVIATARLASSGTADATTYLRGDQTWATVSAGVTGSTGSVDNAMLRADGTGGSTVQASDWLMADNYTASPNNTVNHASLQATGGTTNVSVSVVPKGSGAFSLHVPDGTSTGGNARGANAVDLQTSRTAATQVASGARSLIAGGNGNTVTGSDSAVIAGIGCNVTGNSSVSIAAYDCSISGSGGGLCTGDSNRYGSENSQVMMGRLGSSYPNAQSFTHSSGRFSATGDSRFFRIVGQIKTITNSAVAMEFGQGIGNGVQHFQVPTGRVISGALLIQGAKSDGSVTARYCRHFTIRRVGNATTLDDVQTVGTDYASSTSISITADDTNERLKIEVTGIASETWRWNCVAECIDLAYGT